jgi:hypothetical protein
VPIWINSAKAKQIAAARQSNAPSAYAKLDASMTGTTAAGSVFGRIASNQILKEDII